jgi:outer membrane protein assembly factor BamD (BamD/ComL family)
LIFTFSCASVNDAQKKLYKSEPSLNCEKLLEEKDFEGAIQEDLSKLFLNGEKLLAEKDFEGAIQENQQILSLFAKSPPGDRALFNIATIYAHYDNPARDYSKALKLFRQIVKEYPDSQLLEQSKNWESILVRSTQLQSIILDKTAALNQLGRSKDAIASSNFKEALDANKKILSLQNNTLKKDKALYNIALIYAHYDNPDRSYEKTLLYFSRLIKEYPDSPYREEAKVWSGVIKIIEQSKQVDIEIEKKKKEMAR